MRFGPSGHAEFAPELAKFAAWDIEAVPSVRATEEASRAATVLGETPLIVDFESQPSDLVLSKGDAGRHGISVRTPKCNIISVIRQAYAEPFGGRRDFSLQQHVHNAIRNIIARRSSDWHPVVEGHKSADSARPRPCDAQSAERGHNVAPPDRGVKS